MRDANASSFVDQPTWIAFLFAPELADRLRASAGGVAQARAPANRADGHFLLADCVLGSVYCFIRALSCNTALCRFLTDGLFDASGSSLDRAVVLAAGPVLPVEGRAGGTPNKLATARAASVFQRRARRCASATIAIFVAVGLKVSAAFRLCKHASCSIAEHRVDRLDRRSGEDVVVHVDPCYRVRVPVKT